MSRTTTSVLRTYWCASACAALCVLAACGPGSKPSTTVSGVFVVPGVGASPGVLYATFRNNSTIADTLRAMEIVDTARVMLHENVPDSIGQEQMRPLDHLVIAPNGVTRLAPARVHAMFMARLMAPPGKVRVVFHFVRAGTIALEGRLIDYADVDNLVRPGGAR